MHIFLKFIRYPYSVGFLLGLFYIFVTYQDQSCYSIQFYKVSSILDLKELLDENWSKINLKKNSSSSKVILVTPSYKRIFQEAEILRIAQAIFPAKENVFWIIVEDSRKTSQENIKKLNILLSSFEGLNYTVLISKRRRLLKNNGKRRKNVELNYVRGTEGRNTGIEYCRKKKFKGIIYFGDDDNTYDSFIFSEIAKTKPNSVSLFPVGAITSLQLSSPILNNKSEIADFYDGFILNRDFPVDFAGFALDSNILIENPKLFILPLMGNQENQFLGSLGSYVDFKPLAKNCTEILTWHTKLSRVNK